MNNINSPTFKKLGIDNTKILACFLVPDTALMILRGLNTRTVLKKRTEVITSIILYS